MKIPWIICFYVTYNDQNLQNEPNVLFMKTSVTRKVFTEGRLPIIPFATTDIRPELPLKRMQTYDTWTLASLVRLVYGLAPQFENHCANRHPVLVTKYF